MLTEIGDLMHRAADISEFSDSIQMIHLQTRHSLQSIYLIKGDLEVVFDPSQDAWVKPVLISSWACAFGTSFILVFQGAVHCQPHAQNAMAGHGSVGRVPRRARKGWPGLPWSNASSHWNAFWGSPQSGIHDRLEALELSHGRFAGHIGHISRQTCVKIWSRNRKESALEESISKNALESEYLLNVRSIGAKKFWSSVRQWVLLGAFGVVPMRITSRSWDIKLILYENLV